MILNNYRDLQMTFLSYLTRDELNSIIKIFDIALVCMCFT